MHPAYEKITEDFKKEIHALKLGFSKDLFVRINKSVIQIGLLRQEGDGWQFASEISIYAEQPETHLLGQRDASINFGSSGEFTPENKPCYWRTIHAGLVLQNWSTITDIVNKYCDRWERKTNELFEESNSQ